MNNDLRKYLLGQINDPHDLEKIEDRLIEDREFFNQLEIAEEELIEDYVFGKLEKGELDDFRSYFLNVPERIKKINLTKSLHSLAVKENPGGETEEKKGLWLNWFFKPQFAFGVLLLLVFAFGFLLFSDRFTKSDADIALADLFSIYEKERPVESRIVGLNYSPLIVLRGNNENTENQNKKRRIENQLIEQADKNRSAATLNALGIFYLTERKFDEAIAQFENGLKIDPDNSEIYSNLGAAFYEKAGQAKSAEKTEILPKALESFSRAVELDNSRLEAVFNKSLVLQELNLPREAEKSWNEYLEKDNSSKWAEEARKKLAELEKLKTNGFKSKEEILEDFLRAFREKNDSLAWKIHSQTKETTTLRFLPNQLARRFIAAKQKKLPDEAVESLSAIKYIGSLEESETADFFFRDLAEYFQNIKEQDLEKLKRAYDLTEEGFSIFAKSDYENSQKKLEESRDIFTETGNIWDAKSLESWIAHCLLRKGNLAESRRVLDDLTAFSEERNYKWLKAGALDIKAVTFFIENNISEAIKLNREALAISEEISDTYKQQRISTGLAEIYTRIGESAKAFFYLKKNLTADDLYFQSDRQAWRNYIYGSEVFSRLNLPDAAIAFGRENLQLGGEILKNPAVNHNSHLSLSKLYTEKKDYQNALENAEKSLEMALLLNQDSAQKLLLAHSKLQLGHIKRLSGNCGEALLDYDKALDIITQLPDFKIYSYYAKTGKLFCFQTQKNSAAVEREMPEVLKLYEDHRASIAEEQSRNVFFADGQSVYDIAVENSLAKGDEKRAFEFSENSKARSLLDFLTGKAVIKGQEIEYTDTVKSLNFNEIQARMPDSAQIVEFAVLPEKTVVWILKRDDFKTLKVEIKQEELERKVNDYLTALIEEKDEKELIEQKSAELYKLLIQPFAAELDISKEIFIIPDKVLNRLPFASLYDGAKRKYLIEDFTLSSAPSASVFVLASERANLLTNRSEEKIMAIGNPSFDKTENPNLLNLGSAEREVENIARFYSQTAKFTGENATKKIFLRELKKNDILHFAGHYLANKTSLLNSKLLLAETPDEESDLRVWEIAGQKNPNLKLAILSACQTGIENYYNGEGAVGIARFFLAIGVPTVIASGWEVDSDSTAELMTNFHQNRKIKGLTTAKALREAQIEAIKTTDKSPFYWSAFNSVGGFVQY